MPDREKINMAIAKLQAAGDIALATGCELAKIPAVDALDIADLLKKEREPVKPKKEDAWPNMITVCGACGAQIPTPGGWRYNYCPTCGRKVEWG